MYQFCAPRARADKQTLYANHVRMATAAGGGKHRFYYSMRCRFCQAFLQELSKTPYVPEFALVCVDPSPGRPALPTWLKSVPSLLVAGESSPRVGPGPVNNWLFERKLGGSGAAAAASNSTPRNVFEERNAPLAMPTYTPEVAPRPDATSRIAAPAKLPAAISANTPATASMAPPEFATPSAAGEPAAYYGSDMEAGKISDEFSYIGDTFESKNGVNRIERNFFSLMPATGGGVVYGGAGGAAAAAAGPPKEKQSAKEAALLRDYESFMASRDLGISAPLMRK